MKIENWNMFKLKNKAGTKQFVSYLNEKKKDSTFEEILRVVKISEVFISSSYVKSKPSAAHRIASFLYENYYGTNSDELEEFFSEIAYLESIKERSLSKVNAAYEALPTNLQPIGIIIMLSNELEKNYLANISKETNYSFRSDMQDVIIVSCGMVLKDMMRKNFPFEELSRNLTPQEQNGILNHLEIASELKAVFNIINSWIFGEIRIQENIIDKVTTVEEAGEFNIERLMSHIPFLDLKEARALQSQFFSMGDIDSLIDNMRYLAEMNIREYFYTEDFSQRYKGIKLRDWLEAYWCLVKSAYESVFNDKRSVTYVCVSKREIINKFIEQGIQLSDAELIFSNMIFDKNSIDLYDAPLIKLANKSIVLVPHLLLSIDISRALLSIFGSNNLKENNEISKKGTNFELYIKGLTEIQFSNTISNEKRTISREYELDLAFNIGNDVFLVEAKTQKEPYNYQEFQRNQEELGVYLDKFTKNAEYFESNEYDFFLNKFALTEIDNFYRVFVSNVYQPKNKVGDIYLIDEIDFHNFMKRNPPREKQFNSGGNIISIGIDEYLYAGKPTTNQFLQLIMNSKRNERLKERIGLRETDVTEQLNSKFLFYSIIEPVIMFD